MCHSHYCHAQIFQKAKKVVIKCNLRFLQNQPVWSTYLVMGLGDFSLSVETSERLINASPCLLLQLFHLSSACTVEVPIIVMKVGIVHPWKNLSASVHQYDEFQIDSWWFSALRVMTGLDATTLTASCWRHTMKAFQDCVDVHWITQELKKRNRWGWDAHERKIMNYFVLFLCLLSLSHLILLLIFPHSLYFSLRLSLQIQMEWNECICSHGNNNITVNGRCGDAGAVMADSALSPWVTSWVSHTHTHTHTYTHWMKAVCSPFIQIHFALILQFGWKCYSSVSLPLWLHLNQSHTHTHTHTDILFWTSGLSEWRQTFTHTHTHIECWWRQAGRSVLGQYWTQALSNLMTTCLSTCMSPSLSLSLSLFYAYLSLSACLSLSFQTLNRSICLCMCLVCMCICACVYVFNEHHCQLTFNLFFMVWAP